jgi:hypothetical protein
MVLLPRIPSVENVLYKHDEDSGTAEAGVVVFLSGDDKVAKVAASGNVPFGFLGQQVRENPAGLPRDFQFPSELASNAARVGDPVLVCHNGIYETDQYLLPSGVAAGAALYAKVADVDNNGKLVADTAAVALGFDANPAIVAVAAQDLSADQAAAGEMLKVKLLI